MTVSIFQFASPAPRFNSTAPGATLGRKHIARRSKSMPDSGGQLECLADGSNAPRCVPCACPQGRKRLPMGF
jgi:hypothetical protein